MEKEEEADGDRTRIKERRTRVDSVGERTQRRSWQEAERMLDLG
jgi:hypothetical protein